MTEADWLAVTDPQPMLECLRDRGGAGKRKLRLFALECCRRVDRLITDPRSRAAAAYAQQHVEVGVVRRKGRAAAERAAAAAHEEAYSRMFTFPPGEGRARCLIVSNALDAAAQTLNTHTFYAASYAASFSAYAVAWEAQVPSGEDVYPDLRDSFVGPERAKQAALLRDLFGNPFRPAPVLAPSVLAWNGGTAPRLAAAIYEERAFDRLPVLADALEDAGCTDVEILGHCRRGGEHVRGCWAVDLVLGKG
jgi:hypothetical protein